MTPAPLTGEELDELERLHIASRTGSETKETQSRHWTPHTPTPHREPFVESTGPYGTHTVGTFTKQAYADLAAELHNSFPRLLATIRALQTREADWVAAMPRCMSNDGIATEEDSMGIYFCDTCGDKLARGTTDLPHAHLIRKGAQ